MIPTRIDRRAEFKDRQRLFRAKNVWPICGQADLAALGVKLNGAATVSHGSFQVTAAHWKWYGKTLTWNEPGSIRRFVTPDIETSQLPLVRVTSRVPYLAKRASRCN